MSGVRIPVIDVAALSGPAGAARDGADRAIMTAATGIGFMTITGLPAAAALSSAARRGLLRIFSLPEAEKRKLWRKRFDAAQPNIYRGWFPLEDGGATYKEGIDIGPDLADASWRPDPDDPLTEKTPLPADDVLPGWRADAGHYFRAMQRLGATLMRSVARGLAQSETEFDAPFEHGNSTLRLIRYPERSKHALAGAGAAKAVVEHNGQMHMLAGAAHVDSGFVTLLAQDGVGGLQALGSDGRWADIPPVEGALVVNFGKLLERWTGGRIKATEHRVLGSGRERFSIPFFYEPRVDAVIAPLAGGPAFAPFRYGDHLWSAMTKFQEFGGLEPLRRPRGVN